MTATEPTSQAADLEPVFAFVDAEIGKIVASIANQRRARRPNRRVKLSRARRAA